MKQEIERKFIVIGDEWRATAGTGEMCCQGYITAESAGATVRVRLLADRGFLTIKGSTKGISRSECEYEIPAADAEYMMENLCGDRLVSKKRYNVKCGGLVWEIDEFLGLNEGLLIAEIELEREDQHFEKPAWAGEEVTFDPRYTNAVLARRPFVHW